MEEKLILRNRIKVARAEKNLSQGELAKMVGVSRQTISSSKPAPSIQQPSWR